MERNFLHGGTEMIDGVQSLNRDMQSGGVGDKSVDAAKSQRDQFLKLLTYQLRSQNPLKPYDNQEFATQLAQFSQLEQLTDIRSLIQEQNKANFALSQTMQNSALPGMLGKNAKAMTNHVMFDGDSEVKLGYNLNYPAASGNVAIYNQFGEVVRNIELGSSDMRGGENILSWDGKDDDGNTLEKGVYTFYADFEDSSGGQFSSETFTRANIEAVRFKSEGTMLVIGGMEVALQNVSDISN